MQPSGVGPRADRRLGALARSLGSRPTIQNLGTSTYKLTPVKYSVCASAPPSPFFSDLGFSPPVRSRPEGFPTPKHCPGALYLYSHKELSRNVFQGKNQQKTHAAAHLPPPASFPSPGKSFQSLCPRVLKISPLRCIRTFCLQQHPDSEGSMLPGVGVSELSPWQQES